MSIRQWFPIASFALSMTFTFSLELRPASAEPRLNPATGHFYDFVAASDISWHDARNVAEAAAYSNVDGMRLGGYLATITSRAEDQFLRSYYGANEMVWIGASDAAVEGEWRWVTGPEAEADDGQGLLFWLGDRNGTAIGYENWVSGLEPNSLGDDEDYMNWNHHGDGQWNDVAADAPRDDITGYLVEFGGITVPDPSGDFDFNGDGLADINDTDAIVAAIVAGTDDGAFDLTQDGLVNVSDLTQWLSVAAAENGFESGYLFGDANLDGTVDASDLNKVGFHWLQEPARWSAGDFTADGFVNAEDLNHIGQNWLQSVPSANEASAVPEPMTHLLIASGAVCLMLVRRRPSTWRHARRGSPDPAARLTVGLLR